MKTCFSEGKLMKKFGIPLPLFSKRTPISTNSLFLSNFFMTPLFVQIFKRRTPKKHKMPIPSIEGTMCVLAQ